MTLRTVGCRGVGRLQVWRAFPPSPDRSGENEAGEERWAYAARTRTAVSEARPVVEPAQKPHKEAQR